MPIFSKVKKVTLN